MRRLFHVSRSHPPASDVSSLYEKVIPLRFPPSRRFWRFFSIWEGYSFCFPDSFRTSKFLLYMRRLFLHSYAWCLFCIRFFSTWGGYSPYQKKCLKRWRFLLYMRRLFRQKGQAVLKRQVSSLHEKVILLRIAETSYAANFFSAWEGNSMLLKITHKGA